MRPSIATKSSNIIIPTLTWTSDMTIGSKNWYGRRTDERFSPIEVFDNESSLSSIDEEQIYCFEYSYLKDTIRRLSSLSLPAWLIVRSGSRLSREYTIAIYLSSKSGIRQLYMSKSSRCDIQFADRRRSAWMPFYKYQKILLNRHVPL